MRADPAEAVYDRADRRRRARSACWISTLCSRSTASFPTARTATSWRGCSPTSGAPTRKASTSSTREGDDEGWLIGRLNNRGDAAPHRPRRRPRSTLERARPARRARGQGRQPARSVPATRRERRISGRAVRLRVELQRRARRDDHVPRERRERPRLSGAARQAPARLRRSRLTGLHRAGASLRGERPLRGELRFVARSAPTWRSTIPTSSCVRTPSSASAFSSTPRRPSSGARACSAPGRRPRRPATRSCIEDGRLVFRLGDGHDRSRASTRPDDPVRTPGTRPRPGGAAPTARPSLDVGAVCRSDRPRRCAAASRPGARTKRERVSVRPVPAESTLFRIGALSGDPSARSGAACAHFNGKLEHPWASVTRHTRTTSAVWDFGVSDRADGLLLDGVAEVGGAGLPGRTVNQPTRGVTGHNWTGPDRRLPRRARASTARSTSTTTISTTSEWPEAFSLTVPEEMASGVYAMRLRGPACEEHVPFFVRPAEGGRRNRVAPSCSRPGPTSRTRTTSCLSTLPAPSC